MVFLNSFVVNMQITFVLFTKNDKMYCHGTNTSKNFKNYMNLMLKTEKQEMNYLNYNNALWDRFAFHIAQVCKMMLNRTMLPFLAFGRD